MKFFALFATMVVMSFPYTSHADQIRYQAVWNAGQATSLHTAPLSLSAFRQTGQQLAESGLRLIDIETEIRDGRRVYAGLWTQGSGSNLFEGPISTIAMRNTIIEKRAMGLRLIDFEMFRTPSGARRFLGVWRNGSGEEVLTGQMEQGAFFARGERLTGDGLRLIDVEVEVVNGVLLYSGLFRSGTGSNLITSPLRRRQFVARRDEMVANGLELVDMERIRTGPFNRFVGVWSSGNGESRLSVPRDFGPYFTFVQSQFNDGKHTEDFELQRIVSAPDQPDDGDSRGDDGTTVDDLPTNPAAFSITNGQKLIVEWTHLDDQPFQIELPRSWFPTWLPQKDGAPLLPDNFCALNTRHAHTITWQRPGESSVVEPPFLATPSINALGTEFELGGVQFSGPFGACAGTQTPFVFDFPFTTGEIVFEPTPNLRMVMEGVGNSLAGGTNIDFMAAGAPDGEVLDPLELFKDDTKDKLEGLLKTFADLFEEGEEIDEYCITVGNYWTVACSQFPGACPDPFPVLPTCNQ